MQQEFPKKIIAIVVLAILVVFIMIKASVTIKSGEAGVLFKTFGGGIDTESTYGEGFHFIAPWNDVILYNVKQQKLSESMSVLSSNGLEITVDVTLQFQPITNDLALRGLTRVLTLSKAITELLFPILKSV